MDLEMDLKEKLREKGTDIEILPNMELCSPRSNVT